MKSLLIDNYDSFTSNLYQLLASVNGTPPLLIRNDELSWRDVEYLDFDNVILSPGPGTPECAADFGVCRDVLFCCERPVLGVCLGHQGLGLSAGSRIVRAPEPMHGRPSSITHNGDPLFSGIAQHTSVVRYHSLALGQPLPPDLELIAWTEDGIPMAVRHRRLPRWGVQFHPESILTECGRRLLENFRELTPTRRVSARSTPSLVRTAAWRADIKLLHREIVSDAPFDPARAFRALFRNAHDAFWLDTSAHIPGLSRFSFMGAAGGPLSSVITYVAAEKRTIRRRPGRSGVVTVEGPIFDVLATDLLRWAVPPPPLPFDFACGYVGYFGYELKADLGATTTVRSPQPDAAFIFADRLVVFDHEERRGYLLGLAEPANERNLVEWFAATEATLRGLAPFDGRTLQRSPGSPGRDDGSASVVFELDRDYERYVQDIRQCKKWLYAGESYELCVTNQLRTEINVDSLDLYHSLRRRNPAPYGAYIRIADLCVLSSSPERFIAVDRHGRVESKPIKGTRPRGADHIQDERYRSELAINEKDRSENLMIVDLVRNDLGRICEIDSVRVPKLMQVETFATVHQLVSTITGQLPRGTTAIDAVRSAFPGGSMTGAPKLRTMELLECLEQTPRGVYSGALGFLSLSGTADLSIVIRTIVRQGAHLSIGTGGAIVALSDPDAEFDETLVKIRPLVEAIIGAFREQVGVDLLETMKRRLRECPRLSL